MMAYEINNIIAIVILVVHMDNKINENNIQ